MKTFNRSGVGRRSVSSRAKTFVGVGLGTALLLAGVTLVGVLPASAAASTLTFSSVPTSATAGTALSTFTVNITAGGATADAIVISSSCTFGGGSTLTEDATGGSNPFVATFSNVIIDTGTSCTLTATDSTTGDGGTANSAAVAITPAAASKLAFTTAPPTTAGADVALTTFRVSSEDQYGNVATGATDTIQIGSTCTLGGTLSASEVAGVATFSAVTIDQTGSCILIATDVTNNTITAVSSAAISVSGGTPEKVAFSVAPPASVATTGTVVTAFKVAIEDSLGNIDTTGTGSTDGITISSTCLAAPVAVTAVAGVATFSTVEFATTGSCTLTATDTSRVLVDAIATVQVGTPQAAVLVTTTSGYLDAPLTLAASGGSGTGAVTFTVSNGTATGCTITDGALSATTGGTCIVTATKAAVAPYATGVSAATTVTISSAPKALRVVGLITNGKKSIVTITGYNFSGRPTLVSNVAGFKALVTRDSGKTLTVTITVTGKSKPGVKVMSLTFSNGKRTSVKYSLH
jgi:hypothetical protein